jgi:hypothetical protein
MKRATVWGAHTTPAEAAEAAKTHAAEETALLRAEVTKLTNERDQLQRERSQARMVARAALWELHYQVGVFVNRKCPLCGGQIEHAETCAYAIVKTWNAQTPAHTPDSGEQRGGEPIEEM